MASPDQDGTAAQVAGGDPFDGWREARVDPTKPNIARVYDYWLGGRHNLVADRDSPVWPASRSRWGRETRSGPAAARRGSCETAGRCLTTCSGRRRRPASGPRG